MRRLFSQTRRRIAAVTIGTAKHYVRSFMHGFDTLVTLDTSGAFCVCLCRGLIDPIARGTLNDFSERLGGGNRRRWSKCLSRLLRVDLTRNARDKK